MAKLFYSASAESDLLEAWLYVAEDSVAAADRMLDQIDAQASLLLDQSLMGRDRRELSPGIRSWPTSTPYILFYFPHDLHLTLSKCQSLVLHDDTINVIQLIPVFHAIC